MSKPIRNLPSLKASERLHLLRHHPDRSRQRFVSTLTGASVADSSPRGERRRTP
jgi:hypothetical protein